jgi:hypothetical protein
MAKINAVARQASSVQRVSEGAEVFLRMLRDGSLVGASWKQAAIFQGLGFMVNVGAFSTPITGGGNGTVLDLDQPEFVVGVPSGTSIMPIRVEVTCQIPLLAADSNESEILLAVDQDANYANDGTVTTETIYNMNTLKSVASACKAISFASADITDPTLDIELMHVVKLGDVQGTTANGMWTQLYGLYEPEAPPIINGPAMLVGYFGGTVATTGFAAVQWIEFPSTFSSI